MKKLWLAILILISNYAYSQTTSWSGTPVPSIQNRKFNGANELRFLYGSTNFALSDSINAIKTSLGLYKLRNDSAATDGYSSIGRLRSASMALYNKTFPTAPTANGMPLRWEEYNTLVSQKQQQAYTFPSVTPDTLSGTTYDAFSIIVQFNSGRKAIIYREGASHVGGQGVLKIKYSNDGSTWGSAITFLSESGIDLRNVSGGVTPTGRLVVAYTRYNYGTATNLGAYYVYSDDEGTTKSSQLTLQTGNGSSYGNLLSIGDGKLLLPLYSTGNSEVVISSDNALTFGSPITIAATGGGNIYSEASAAYLGGGVITALVREDSGSQRLTQVKSVDNGVTWTNQGQVSFGNVSQVSPALSTYTSPSGKLMISAYYADRSLGNIRVVSGGASEIASGVSGWNASSLYSIASFPSDPTGAHFGYPSVIQNGRSQYVLGTYYQGGSAVTHIKFFTYPPTSSLPVSIGDMNITGGVYKVDGVAIPAGTVTSFGKTDNYGIISTVTNPTTTPIHAIAADTTSAGGLMSKDRAAANYATIAGLAGKQATLSGTGFVKSTAGTISYDNSTYYKLGDNISIGTIDASGAITVNFNPPSSLSPSIRVTGADGNGNLVGLSIESNGGAGSMLSILGSGASKAALFQATGSGSGAGNNKFTVGTATDTWETLDLTNGNKVFAGNISATLPAYSTGARLLSVYNGFNNRFETTTDLPSGTTAAAPSNPNEVARLTDVTSATGFLKGSTFLAQTYEVAPTTGQTVSPTRNFKSIIRPTTALAALTISLPSSPNAGEIVWITITQPITTISYTNGTAATAPTTTATRTEFSLAYSSATGEWH